MSNFFPLTTCIGGSGDINGICPATNSWQNRYVPNQNIDNDEAESVKEHACETLALCILTTLNKGLRNGGGIGDVLRPPSLRVNICNFMLTVLSKKHFVLLSEIYICLAKTSDQNEF